MYLGRLNCIYQRSAGLRLTLAPVATEPSYWWAHPSVRFGAHNGLKSDIVPCPKSADTVEEVFSGEDRKI
jgi:hypothetical protein